MLYFCLTTVLVLLTCNLGDAADTSDTRGSGDLLRGVTVPQYAFAGGQATLSCSYDLRARRLYSLKWYHNDTEFYRYVPTERNTPINIKPTHKFSVTELFRNDQRVTLSLTRLSVSASGEYRCEVIAEHPSFRTEWYRASMTVLMQNSENIRSWCLHVRMLGRLSEADSVKVECEGKIRVVEALIWGSVSLSVELYQFMTL
nr:uncharacterized protein LOC128686285 [Cherax quadricarinatus]